MEKVIYSLPTSVEVNGTEYTIQSDYRAVLDILTALSDGDLDEQDKAEAALTIFYPEFSSMPASDYQRSAESVLPVYRPRAGGKDAGKTARRYVVGAGF